MPVRALRFTALRRRSWSAVSLRRRSTPAIEASVSLPAAAASLPLSRPSEVASSGLSARPSLKKSVISLLRCDSADGGLGGGGAWGGGGGGGGRFSSAVV